MSNHDERVATASHNTAGHSDATASSGQDKADFGSILKLIGAQIEDSDRRQSQVLTEMTDRVNELEGETTSAENQPASDFTPALARVQDGLAQLAEQISGRQKQDIQPSAEQASTMAQHVEIAPLASASHQGSPAVADPSNDAPGGADEPWTAGDAEQLMQVFETQHSDVNQDGSALEDRHSADTASPDSHSIQDAIDPEPQAEGLSVEREWLEQRFAEIAVRVEQSIREMRDDDPIIALRERFSEFQENVGNALNGVATRADIEALRTAEGEISDLRELFEQVQKQFTRLDAVESQLEAVFDRLSDDRLVALLAGHGNSPEDRAELAVAVGEYVATRVVKDDTGAEQTNVRIDKLHRAVVTLLDEQRKGDEHNAGALDTLQAAMVEVIDRVEAIDVSAIGVGAPVSAQYAQPQPPQPQRVLPEEMPAYAASEPEQYEPEHVSDSQIEGGEADDGLSYSPSLSVGPSASTAHEASLDAESENVAPARGVPDNSPAIEAATAAANRHPDFEPFTENVAGSASIAEHAMPEAGSSLGAAVQMYADSVDQPLEATEETQASPLQSEVNEPSLEADDPDGFSQQQVPQNTIDRIRQEFVAEAQRAKVAADAQAAADALEGPKPQKSRSKFGIGMGNGLLLKQASRGEQSNLGDSAPVASKGKIFGIPSRKILIGAFVLIVAATGIKLLVPKGTTPSPAQPAAIERVIPSDMSTSKSAQESGGSTQLKPFTSESSDERPVEYGGDGDNVSDDELPSEALGDRSEIHDGQIHEYNRVLAPGRPAVTKLNGIAMQIAGRSPTDRDIARLSQQRSMAHWSEKLGEAAGNATMATLLPEYQESAYVPVNASTSQGGSPAFSKTVNVAPVTETLIERRALDLPPATVGPLTLRLAAAKGDPSAEFEVGARLAAGKGTGQNLKKAAHWYKRSASRGFAQAQYRLGTLYERGLGVKKDLSRAQIWYRRAAEQGSTKAMHNLAVLSAGKSAKGPDYTTAFHWFAKAAAYGLADSQFNLAVLYENGLGVKKDLKAAYKYYDLAAGAGDKDAISRRDILKKKLSAEQLAAAKILRATWRPKKTVKLANDAFVAGQAWKSRASNSFSR